MSGPVEIVVKLPEKCTCGSVELVNGYGLAGGGMGEYVICESCSTMFKRLDVSMCPKCKHEWDDDIPWCPSCGHIDRRTADPDSIDGNG